MTHDLVEVATDLRATGALETAVLSIVGHDTVLPE
jgi:hypothetical protein